MIVSIDLGFGAIPFCTIYGALMLGNNYTYTATRGGDKLLSTGAKAQTEVKKTEARPAIRQHMFKTYVIFCAFVSNTKACLRSLLGLCPEKSASSSPAQMFATFTCRGDFRLQL